MKDLRDHGLGTIPHKITGAPTWTPCTKGETCPNCHGNVVEVQVPVSSPVVTGGNGVGHYLGCPACPWAGPMLVVSATAAAH